MELKMNQKAQIILGIILTIIVLILAIYINSNTQNEYVKKLNIDTEKLNIFYFYVGQADCTLITLNGKSMLIDAGNESDGYHIVEFLKSQNITKLDYLIGTHVDEDHIGGMDKVIQQIQVNNLYIPTYNNNNKSDYNEIKDSLKYNKNKNLKLSILNSGDNLTLSNASFNVLSANSIETVKDINNTSIVLQLNYKEKKYLFTGDIRADEEKELVKNNKLEKIDILKVSHHGSNSSSCKEFLEATSPKQAIISSGSTYDKFPNTEFLKSIVKKVNIDNLYFTERDGTIWVISDGQSDDTIQKKDTINLDGGDSKINPNELSHEFLESIRKKYAFFFIKYCKIIFFI